MRAIASIMLRCAPLLLAAALSAGPWGCSTTRPGTGTLAASAQHAECMVCKFNADLACVDVEVDETTPRTVYQGRTYFFCSQHCLHEFEKAPGKYVAP